MAQKVEATVFRGFDKQSLVGTSHSLQADKRVFGLSRPRKPKRRPEFDLVTPAVVVSARTAAATVAVPVVVARAAVVVTGRAAVVVAAVVAHRDGVTCCVAGNGRTIVRRGCARGE